ncbi:alpha/beta hydrolase family protein [Roseibacillus persicicus]|uniref:alpha/beta hydrolase family protein n=1 Tax=Roseibacillus persicicus TaxID=454148 RepID=UPI00280F2C05|nr:alpha/beta hydrolase [Roseibacillus persicicus]MDQ8192225.1 alpha/beta hydrolase [Roseibacillus persicicus]
MRPILRLFFFLSLTLLGAAQDVTPTERFALKKQEGKTLSFHGFEGVEFTLGSGALARVVFPREAAEDHPWIWRARFWGHQPALDIALLEKGYHVCYCDVANLYGSPQAVARWDEFYRFSQELELHPKPILEGMSRGGLIVFNWAKANPEKVSAIYGDNPVCDIRSWPRGKSAKDWEGCLSTYGISEEQSVEFKGNPIDGLEELAAAKVPLFFVLGEADEVVPIEENALILSKRYQALKGSVTIWRKPGQGHHPHGLSPVEPLVKALLECRN